MKILSLGHICYLLEMTPRGGGEAVRILGDPWLSDYAIGDLMGRFPRVRYRAEDLEPIHAIFLSHSHTDHLDPYTLVRLWGELRSHPTLILPESLRHLEGLLRDHLKDVEILYLQEETPVLFRGLQLNGFFNPETRPTNEDDVMVLQVESDREVFLSESDAILPFYDPEIREILSSTLANPDLETVCFLTAKNELEATMSMLSASDPEDRESRVSRSIERTSEEIFEIYTPVEEPEGDLWQNERLVRLVGGQGMCFPQELGTDWNRVLFPLRLEDRVELERSVATGLGCLHSVEEFKPGSVHHLADGRLREREIDSFVRLLDSEEDRHFEPKLELFDDFPVAPLVDSSRDRESQQRRILEVLNQRFLPHLIGSRSPPVEHLLSAHDGEYRIRVRFGTVRDHEDRDYRLSFASLQFGAGSAAERQPDEFYWANDIEDFLDGRCDEFSIVCRKPLGAPAQRLWSCLGLPYLNNDLIEKKLRFHFERAAKDESLEEWVLGFYRS